MGNSISFKDFTGGINSHKSELLVCGIFEGEKVNTTLDILINSNYDLKIKSLYVFFICFRL